MDSSKTWEYLLSVLVASAGGMARLLRHKDKMKIGIGKTLSDLFISGFSGLMALFLGRALGLNDNWVALGCGSAGYMGPKTLDWIIAAAAKKFGVDVNKVASENDSGGP